MHSPAKPTRNISWRNIKLHPSVITRSIARAFKPVCERSSDEGEKLMRRAPVLVCIAVLGSMLVWAAESWRNKQVSEWTPTDVTKILSNSPWAHEVTVTMSAGSGQSGGRRGGGDWGESGGGTG